MTWIPRAAQVLRPIKGSQHEPIKTKTPTYFHRQALAVKQILKRCGDRSICERLALVKASSSLKKLGTL